MAKRRLALSVHQPFAELIMLGEKNAEFRSRPTNIRGRVYVYASRTFDEYDREICEEAGLDPDELPRGVIVGSVEIVDCVKDGKWYAYILENPKRLKRPLKPTEHPQPKFFYPFGR